MATSTIKDQVDQVTNNRSEVPLAQNASTTIAFSDAGTYLIIINSDNGTAKRFFGVLYKSSIYPYLKTLDSISALQVSYSANTLTIKNNDSQYATTLYVSIIKVI